MQLTAQELIGLEGPSLLQSKVPKVEKSFEEFDLIE